jgi:hypothetical protein
MAPTYRLENLKEIANAIGKSTKAVKHRAQKFEDAATWYRSWGKSTKRITPYELKRRFDSISSHARKLLKGLGINNPEDAPDGTIDPNILAALTNRKRSDELDVSRAADKIALLHKIISAVNAASDLESWATDSVEKSIKVGKLTTFPGHSGDWATYEWIADMMVLYRDLTRRAIATSTDPKSRPKAGKATGPLVRFLAAAGKPLELEMSAEAWRERVRRIQENKNAQN